MGKYTPITEHIKKYNIVNKNHIVWQIETGTYSRNRIGFYCKICANNGIESVYECRANDVFNNKLIPCKCGKRNHPMTSQDYLDKAKEIVGEEYCNKIIGCIDSGRSGYKIAIDCEYHGVYFKHFSNLKKQGWHCLKCTPPDYGFDRNSLSYLYVLSILSPNNVNFLGYGITGNLKRRFMEHKYYLKSIGATITNIQVFEGSGTAVLAVENAIKSLHPTGLIDCEGFRRESISIDMKDKVLEKCSKLKELDNVDKLI